VFVESNKRSLQHVRVITPDEGCQLPGIATTQ